MAPAEIVDELPHYNQSGKRIAGIRNPSGKPVELLVKRRFDRIVNLRFLIHLAHLGGITHLEGTHHAMSLHDFRPAQHMIGRIGGVTVKMLRVGGLGA